MSKILIIDYGMGNLRSVQKKIERIGFEAHITADLNEINDAKKFILPGIGHFKEGMKQLKDRGIESILHQKVLHDKIPVFGICLGMQLMASFSEEGGVAGLGWFNARVQRFQVSDTLKFKVPQIGWNSLNWQKESRICRNTDIEDQYYFVHSYHMNCSEKQDVLSYSTYDYPFVSAVEKDHIVGTQFHPEKSHTQGELLLKNFLELY